MIATLFPRLLLLLASPASAEPGFEPGLYTGAVFVGPEHELYDWQIPSGWKAMGPAVPLGVRGAYFFGDLVGVEGELHAGVSPVEGASLAMLWAGRAHAIVRIGPMLGDLALRPHLVGGGGLWGVRSGEDALGADLDRAFHVGPGASLQLTDALALRADVRYLIVAKQGAGASEVGGTTEVLVGVSLRRPAPAPIDPATLDDDSDGILNGVDACPTEPETVNVHKDEDGCPDQLGAVTVFVVDKAGAPAGGVEVFEAGARLGVTDAGGALALQGARMPGTALQLTATHPALGRGAVSAEVVEGDNAPRIDLTPVLGQVRVRVTDQSGAPIGATLKATGVAPFPGVTLGATGEGTADIIVGKWEVFVSAEGFGTERRPVEVREGEITDLGVILLAPARVEVRATIVEVKEKILFASGGHEIDAASLTLVDAIATLLVEHPELRKIEVAGHTDSRGDDASNLDLSQRRVDSVVQALTARGVDSSRLVAKGFGETEPVGDNNTAAGREANRRVEFRIVARD